MSERDSATTTLYRFFDSAGILLYVGISAQPLVRFGQHRADKPWWVNIGSITTHHYTSRRAALEAEAEAVKTERPLYNVVHNPEPPVDGLTAFEYLARLEPRLAYLEESCQRRRWDYEEAVERTGGYEPDPRSPRCMDDYWFNDLRPRIIELVGWRRKDHERTPVDAPTQLHASMLVMFDKIEHAYEHPNCVDPPDRLLSTSAAYDIVTEHLNAMLPPCFPTPCPRCI